MGNIKHLVITHKNCADGVLAATLMASKFNIPLEDIFELGHCNNDATRELDVLDEIGLFIQLDQYHKDSNIDSIHLFVVDYMLQLKTMRSILTTYGKVYITTIDHHANSIERVEEYRNSLTQFNMSVLAGEGKDGTTPMHTWYRTAFYLSEKYSGAGLAWLYRTKCTYGPEYPFQYHQMERIEDTQFMHDITVTDYVDGYIDTMPTIVQYVQDADIWQWRFKEQSAPFNLGYNVFGRSLNNVYEFFKSEGFINRVTDTNTRPKSTNVNLKLSFDTLLESFISDKITAGLATMEYRQGLLESAKKSTTPISIRLGYRKVKGVIVNSHLGLASSLGNQLVEPYVRPDGSINNIEFAIIYTREYDTTQGAKYSCSIRSRDDSVDCNAIAGLFGGGGHKQASGFKIYGDKAFLETFNDFVDNGISIFNNVKEKLLAYLKFAEANAIQYVSDSMYPETQLQLRFDFISYVKDSLRLNKDVNRLSVQDVYQLLSSDSKLRSALSHYFELDKTTGVLRIIKWWVLPIFYGSHIKYSPKDYNPDSHPQYFTDNTTDETGLQNKTFLVLRVIWSHNEPVNIADKAETFLTYNK